MITVKINRFMKTGMLGLAGCLIALGAFGTAFAADTSPEERAAQIAFEKPTKPYASVTWTSEQFRAGAQYAALLDGEGSLPDGLIVELKERMQPQGSASLACREASDGSARIS